MSGFIRLKPANLLENRQSRALASFQIGYVVLFYNILFQTAGYWLRWLSSMSVALVICWLRPVREWSGIVGWWSRAARTPCSYDMDLAIGLLHPR